jgi:hypothetical protein
VLMHVGKIAGVEGVLVLHFQGILAVVPIPARCA